MDQQIVVASAGLVVLFLSGLVWWIQAGRFRAMENELESTKAGSVGALETLEARSKAALEAEERRATQLEADVERLNQSISAMRTSLTHAGTSRAAATAHADETARALVTIQHQAQQTADVMRQQSLAFAAYRTTAEEAAIDLESELGKANHELAVERDKNQNLAGQLTAADTVLTTEQAARAAAERKSEMLERQLVEVAHIGALPTLWQLLFESWESGNDAHAAFNTRPRDSRHYGQASKGLRNLTDDYIHLHAAIPLAVKDLGIKGLTVKVCRAGICDLVTLAYCESVVSKEDWRRVAERLHAEAVKLLLKCSTGYAVHDGTVPVNTVNDAVFLAFKAEVACRQQIGLNDYTNSAWLRRALKRVDLQSDESLWSAYETVQKDLDEQNALSEVNVLFQPKYSRVGDTAEWKLSGAEALIRYREIGAFPLVAALRDRNRINDCTTTRVIPAIGHLVRALRLAGDDMNRFNDDFRISFNVFPSDLTEEHAQAIVKAVKEVCTANHFEVEILEEGDPCANMTGAIKILRDEGLSIALDDFGDRMANLERLLSTMPDKVKLDQKIVRPSIDEERSAFLRSIVAALDSTDIRTAENASYSSRVVAEGAETREHLKVLMEIGVREVQGFVFSKPLAERDFITLYQRFRTVEGHQLPLTPKLEDLCAQQRSGKLEAV